MMKYPVFDSHCDTATELWRRNETLERTSCHISLTDIQKFSGYAQFFAFCTYSGRDPVFSAKELLHRPCRYFTDQIEKRRQLQLCHNIAQMDEAVAAGKTAAFFALEGAEGIGCDPGRLSDLRQAGFTMVNLTWNGDNALAGCSLTDGPGLSRQGREFVKTAQRLGIMIDVSHISDKAFWDIMEISEAPVVASHSNCRSLCAHSRNLTDEQYLAICQSGGYVGINLYSPFLKLERRAVLDDIYAHIDHFMTLCGGHVALGGDWDGCDTLPSGFRSIGDYEKLAEYLENKNYSEDTVGGIFCNTIKEVVNLCTM